MNRIHRLDEATINAIAAGEVVDRPCSVVRELVDNALDAGASLVRVEIVGGGIRKITVTDDGTGMAPDDALLSLERHATSKLSGEADLWRIGTLGFRGEALASIAAVSKLTLTSREIGRPSGFRIENEGGTVLSAGETGAPEGTSVTVRELFYNTPARFKFLKSDAAEAGRIGDSVAQLALTRPDVSFQLIRDNRSVLHTPGNGDLRSAIFAVFGADLAESMRPIAFERHAIRLEGFIGSPETARGTRARQVFIVNGRVVRSRSIGQAVDEASKSYFMKGKYPALVLTLRVPSELVDVNVHPQKSEVRFWDDKKVFSAVYRAVEAALSDRPDEPYGQPAAAGRTEKTDTGAADPGDSSAAGTEIASVDGGRSRFESVPGRENLQVRDGRRYESAGAVDSETAAVRAAAHRLDRGPIAPDRGGRTGEENTGTDTGCRLDDDAAGQEAKVEETAPVQLGWQTTGGREVDKLAAALLLGQYGATYLVLEEGGDLLLLDQHAAHERILYERLLAADDTAPLSCQMLLMPLEVGLTPSERALVDDAADEIARFGFEVEPFGPNTVVLRGVPDLKENHDPKVLFLALIDSLSAEGTKRDRHEAFAMKACKAAIKANDRLTREAMVDLIAQLASLDNPYHCPHGRPIVVRLTKKEIEKRFGRIV